MPVSSRFTVAARVLIASAVVAVALIVPSVGSASAKSVDPTAAATACAAGRPLGSRFGATDLSYLGRFLPCVIQAERSQLGLTYTQNGALSGVQKQALGRFVRLPYFAEHDPKAVASTEAATGKKISVQACRQAGAPSGKVRYQVIFADTMPPPVLTPRTVANALANALFQLHGVARSAKSVFGIAVRFGVLFESHDLRGTALAIMSLRCP